ncbi:MAG: glycosyltransferase family 4 protein [Prochlorococcaceae cyanobacterium]
MTPSLLLAHPTGNTFFRASARAFQSAGWLRELHSCICWDPGSALALRLPHRLTVQLQRRAFLEIPLHLQHSHPWRELGRLASASLPLAWLRRHEQGPLSVDGVYRSFDRHVAARLPALRGLDAVYAYEDGALRTFEAAEALGLRRIYDLPIGYWRAARQIFEEERALQPEWACTLTGLNDSAAKLARKDRELQLADLVIVPSQFVRSTLLQHGASTAPIAVVPFGSPPPLAEPPQPRAAGPLRVLYVGSLGQRKGLSYALDAVGALGSQVSLTLIGRPTAPECRPLCAALGRHRWIETLPHPQILEQMRHHDVLVLPSLFEGYALVISEALSQGLPVIATASTGAPESVRDRVEGFIVPLRDSQAIAERLQRLADDPDLLAGMREACLRRAAAMSWATYEQGLLAVVGQALLPGHQAL